MIANNQNMPSRFFDTPNSTIPEVHLLSNGRYHVMITSAGDGYSRWKNLAVDRCLEDSTCDAWGTYCYLRDVTSGNFWSTTYQPALRQADTYEAVFSEGRAIFQRRDDAIETVTEIVVSPEDDGEVRRIRITNQSGMRRKVDITSYGEIVFTPSATDSAHPAFNKLFIETEILRESHVAVGTPIGEVFRLRRNFPQPLPLFRASISAIP